MSVEQRRWKENRRRCRERRKMERVGGHHEEIKKKKKKCQRLVCPHKIPTSQKKIEMLPAWLKKEQNTSFVSVAPFPIHNNCTGLKIFINLN